ncbi:GNAT family N-acetyltransferase [Alicyclobacillus dauci]|uniref:GNAT family N-acetyltransferase n=1 Tax=Alicyclobacillus dauci TaxID=1475485 RepID=A0ABY6Z410_9BACL|nr:GNAT family N-acetyltransferase [Alicyclobacillus dauci]WAH37577.1 GNAT family N-acetyltransferase [Alicyclobacillus dauci]
MRVTRTTDYDLVARLNRPIHDLHRTLYPEYFKEYVFDDMRDAFKRLMTNDNSVFLLLEDDNEALGYAWIEVRTYPDNAFRKEYRSVYVHQISIVENQKRRGHGSYLMEHIYDIAKREGIHRVELDYWARNEAAKAFYEKHGFVSYRDFVHKEL